MCEFEDLLEQLFKKTEHFMWKWQDEKWSGVRLKKN
jgi:hypothetical protein